MSTLPPTQVWRLGCSPIDPSPEEIQKIYDKDPVMWGRLHACHILVATKNSQPQGSDASVVDKEAQRRVELVYNWDMLLVGGMHFQDSYNYNIDRVKRCSIHYAAPNGRMYPFCTYNSGPVFREKIERQFSVPLEAWRKQNRKEEEADYYLCQ